jgi:hypothetical protein
MMKPVPRAMRAELVEVSGAPCLPRDAAARAKLTRALVSYRLHRVHFPNPAHSSHTQWMTRLSPHTEQGRRPDPLQITHLPSPAHEKHSTVALPPQSLHETSPRATPDPLHCVHRRGVYVPRARRPGVTPFPSHFAHGTLFDNAPPPWHLGHATRPIPRHGGHFPDARQVPHKH